MKDVSLTYGKPLKLEAVLAGVPKPAVQWFKDDEPLDENIYNVESKDKTHSVMIAVSDVQHSGTYKAVAENPAGKVDSISTVEIQTKPKITKPDDIKIISGSQFIVPVTIKGNPEPKIKWMKDKVELPASLGITVDKKEDVYTMFLKESNTNLNGSYAISATNPAGSDTANFKVSVLGK